MAQVHIDVSWQHVTARRLDGQPFSHYFLAAVILNTALAVRFELTDDTFFDPLKVQGSHRDWPIELRNWEYHDPSDTFGLIDDETFQPDDRQQEILDWYAGLLRLLLIDELVAGSCSYGHAAWLELREDRPASRQDIFELMTVALLVYSRDPVFVDAVFQRIQWETEHGTGLRVAGLTNEEVAAMFAGPPLTPFGG